MNWLEVSLTVSGELAEAVADVLARFAPEGVTTEQEVVFLHEEDAGTPAGPVTVRAYLKADAELPQKCLQLETALGHLGMIQALPAPKFTPVVEQNWMEAWKAHYQPIPVGRRLVIVPAWLKAPQGGRIPIRIDPGMAFGTGTHPSTQLCLELIEEQYASPGLKPSPVIDVGCGSGILSIAALKLGSRFALGVDIDAAAVKASRENAAANRIPKGSFAVHTGSVAEILEGKFRAGGTRGGKALRDAPLVLANILAPTIIRLFEDGLAKLVSPGGALILAGILDSQVHEVVTAMKSHGMRLGAKRQMEDWVALLAR